MIEKTSINKTLLQLTFVLKNKDLKSRVRRINLKWILLNNLKWIWDEFFRILHGLYQPTQVYLRADMSLPTWASLFSIYAGDGNRLHVMTRPVNWEIFLWFRQMTMSKWFNMTGPSVKKSKVKLKLPLSHQTLLLWWGTFSLHFTCNFTFGL